MFSSAIVAFVVWAGQKTTGPGQPIEKPAEKLAQGYYTKCVYFRDLPIIASAKVDDKALRRAVDVMGKMLAKAPKELIPSLVKRGSHFSIIGATEGQTDLPEYADLRNDPKTDWNKRARGLGGEITSAGEENILELDSDRYKGESIFIHEFSHTLASEGFTKIDKEYSKDLRAAFKNAQDNGLWKNTYAITNEFEYWAEGVQSYFDCNRSASPPNGIHNDVCNRERLQQYDPKLFALVDRSFGGNPWRYDGKYCTTGK